ncbi:type II secretion system F family protein [Dietzia massiliensis]|uniref:type II secretion system F family protein n=1 Tax=Dietzia massiliensis TaxID=2697499 RepID=UPI001BD1AB6D|nr:type II secretion system F family protein [Dietzia massiliensis]MBS7548671.1 type II secretion system F family protein [Dietzia massiliensis]
MTAALVLVAVALLVWPGGRAADRLAALEAGGFDRAAGDGAAGRATGSAGAGAAAGGAATGAAQRIGALGSLVLQVPASLSWPVAAGLVGLVGAGPLHACAAAVLGGVAADLHGRATERRGRLTRLGAWERALDDAASALRAGAGPGAALGRAADAAAAHDRQVGDILAAAGSHARLGGDVTAALLPAATVVTGPAAAAPADGSKRDLGGDRVPGELAGAWLLATRHGVELADVVDGLRADVASRRERAVRTRATLAGPRATAVILTALPGLGVLLGAGFGADPLGVLLSGTLGGALCLAGAVLLAAGLLWTDRIAGGAAR